MNIQLSIRQSKTNTARYWPAGLVVLLTAMAAIALTRPTAPTWEPAKACELHFSNGAVLIGVPVAETAEQQTRGLSKRYDAGTGMLFSWASAEPRIFWMRDTWIPLTIGFFDENGLLFSVQNMQPESDDYHFSIQPALNALELSLGQFEIHGLREGVRMTGRICNPLGPESGLPTPKGLKDA